MQWNSAILLEAQSLWHVLKARMKMSTWRIGWSNMVRLLNFIWYVIDKKGYFGRLEGIILFDRIRCLGFEKTYFTNHYESFALKFFCHWHFILTGHWWFNHSFKGRIWIKQTQMAKNEAIKLGNSRSCREKNYIYDNPFQSLTLL